MYVFVIARNQPQFVPNLMDYHILRLETNNEDHGNYWLAYDTGFRQQAAS